jgi:segregation and condensation protein A
MKSRLLLPVQERPVLEDEVQEIEQDLLDHLMHYRVFKQAAIDLKERSKFYSRYKDFEAEEESKIFLVDVTLRDLVVAFQKVWDAAAASEEQEIEGEQFTVAQKIREIIDKVKQKPEGLEFEALFERMVRIEIIVTFLAMLELIRQRAIRITQGKTFGSILLFAVC